MSDWDDGSYELTAEQLRPAAATAVAAAGLRAGERVLDVACGTGNAALLAAQAGATVTGVDSAERLRGVARERARAASVEGRATFVAGDAGALPVDDESFDATVSVFGVIFATDALLALDELVRVTRPGGRIVLTTWLPTGPIATAGRIVHEALASVTATDAAPAPPRLDWGDEAVLSDALTRRGTRVAISRERLAFAAPSPTAWLDEQVRHHPIWRMAHAALAERPEEWEVARARTIAALEAGNEDPAAFRTTSAYLLVRADRPA